LRCHDKALCLSQAEKLSGVLFRDFTHKFLLKSYEEPGLPHRAWRLRCTSWYFCFEALWLFNIAFASNISSADIIRPATENFSVTAEESILPVYRFCAAQSTFLFVVATKTI
jgi:hypothetical protein